MGKIENFKYTISEAFNHCFYIIPDYQREYVWSEKEVQQLLDDINHQMDGAVQEYFIGTILVSPGGRDNFYEVIDGQQRLTTLFLLLCSLRNHFAGKEQYQAISNLIRATYTDSEGDIVSTYKLDLQYENANELLGIIVETDSDPSSTRKEVQAARISPFGSLENLLNAYDVVYRYALDNYPDHESLKKFWAYLANKVVFIQISTDVNSALKIFETINERGVGLNPMDLLKNLLFTQVRKEEFSKLKRQYGVTPAIVRSRVYP